MDRSNHYNRIRNKLNLCVYAIATLSLGSSALAQTAPTNTNIAGPSASATGNVTNQAVQVLQGPFAVNSYGPGISCQGPSLNISPFILGGLSGDADPSKYQSHTGNGGISLGFNIPLDGGLTALCKERAKVETARQQAEADKARLDFELVRLLKCGEAIKLGVTFHPKSPYVSICSDVVVKYPPIKNANTTDRANQREGTGSQEDSAERNLDDRGADNTQTPPSSDAGDNTSES